MKRQFFMLVFLILTAALFAAAGTIQLQSTPTRVELLSKDANGLTVNYSLDELRITEVSSKEGVWSMLAADQYTSTNEPGLPALPLMRQLIQVPLGASVSATFTTSQQRTIDLATEGVNYPLMPYQESVSKSADMNNLPFEVQRDFYNADGWTSYSPVKVSELGMMRGVRIFALDFVPVRYNPAQKKIEVIYNAQIRVSFSGGDQSATRALQAKTYSPAFEPVFSNSLLNFEPTRATLNRHPMSYVVILPDNYVSAMQPFVNWKIQEGYNVIVAPTSTTGTTANAIKTYLQNIWNTATTENPAPSYLLIVGDVAQVPSNNGTTGTHPTDLTYVRLQGTDFMPEMYFGRFSATTPAEVTNQVNKTLMHEQYTMPDDDYLAEVVMIAGVDGTYGPTHANGQINYGTTNYFNAAHGITSHTYLYPTSGSSEAAILANISAGVGYANYTAHGDVTIWYDPNVTISNVNNLNNVNKSAFVVGNCCLTSKFDAATCFAEAWLRAPNKGGVVYIGGTNSTYWNEDYYWGVGYKPPVVGTGSPFVPNRTGAYDAVFHDHNEPFADWAGNAGSMIFMGNMAVVASNSSRINYYWEIYSVMGDPSLAPYMGIPQANSYEAPSQMFLGMSSMDIQADPYSYVALSMNGVLHGVGLADAGGILTLNYTPFTEPGTATLVMTRSMRKPLIASIAILPNVGPYVTAGQLVINDGNNNIAEAGESLNLSLVFNNVGVQDATNLTATLSSTNEWVAIPTPTATLPNIPAGQTVTMTDLFGVNINPNIPDQDVVEFAITVTDGTNTWVTERSMTVNAPQLSFGNLTYFDSNGDGVYVAGETITVSFNVANTGHMNAGGGNLYLVENSPNATLDVTNFTIPALNIGGTMPLSFNVMIGAGAVNGEIIGIGIALNSGAQMVNTNAVIPIGPVGEGFESNSFSTLPWVNNSAVPWTIVTGASNAHSGSYAAKSGTIGNNANTALQLTMNVETAGNITFWRKVSSENNYDFLKFYIDNVELGSWSGTQAWTQMTYPVTTGSHTFKWTYVKDGSQTGGSDSAWIDDIILPGMGLLTTPIIFAAPQTIVFDEVESNDVLSADLVIRNLGNAELTGIISIPDPFELTYDGVTHPDTYSYSISAGATQTYAITYHAPAQPSSISEDLIITSNDPNAQSTTIILQVIPSTAGDDPGLIPVATALDANYPNPFNPETTIRFATKEAGDVRINIYNLKGQLVRNLVNDSRKAGFHRALWNGKDDNGRNVSSGIYLYRMETTGFSATRKMMLMK